jgi:hypothetical protein
MRDRVDASRQLLAGEKNQINTLPVTTFRAIPIRNTP